MNFRSFLVLWLLVLGCGSVAGQKTLSDQLPEVFLPGLDRILKAAIDESSTMRMRTFTEEEKAGELKIARSYKLPRVSTIASYRKEEPFASEDVPGALMGSERLIYGLQMTQPIFHWGVLDADKKVGEIGYRNAQLGSEREFGKLAHDIRGWYLDLILGRQRMEFAVESVAAKRKELETEKMRVEEGFASQASLSGLEFGLSQLELDEIRAEREFRNKVSSLAAWSGMEPKDVEFGLNLDIPQIDRLSETDVIRLRKNFETAVASDHNSIILENNIEAARLNLLKASNRLKPNLDFVSGLTQNERDISGRLTEEQFAYAGLAIRWDIFDGHESAGYKRVALSRLQRAEESRQLHGKRLSLELEAMLADFDISSRILEASEKHLSDSIASRDRIVELLESKSASAADATAAELNLKRQTLSTQGSRVNYLKSLSKLVSELGTDPYVARFRQTKKADEK